MLASHNIKTKPLKTFDRDDIHRRRNILNILLAGIGILAGVILVLAIAFYSPGDTGLQFVYLAAPPLLLICGVIYYIAKRNVKVASLIFISLLIMGTAISDTPREVIEGRSLFFMIAPIMIASFIISPAASYYSAFAAGLTLFGLASTFEIPMNFIGVAGFFLFAFVSWLAANAYENTLSELKVINIELDKRVDERTHELAAALERLKELDKLKSKFVSDVSHELRTPISNISMYLEMLEHGDQAKFQQYLEVLGEDSKRLIKLVEDTLDLSRLEGGDVKKEYSFINLNEICENVTISSKLRSAAKGLDLQFIPGMNLPQVWAVKDHITQVAANLVANAINYTPTGAVHVETFYDADNSFIGFSVKDTGLGITPEDRQHLFERFYRGDRASQSTIPGTGLGLAICQEIINEHNGHIEVESAVNSGSKFTVYLPLTKPNPHHTQEPDTPSPNGSPNQI